MFYGFVVENNDNDLVPLSIDFKDGDPLLDLKKDMIEVDCTPRVLKVGENVDCTRFNKLISYLRFVEYDCSNLYLLTVLHYPFFLLAQGKACRRTGKC